MKFTIKKLIHIGKKIRVYLAVDKETGSFVTIKTPVRQGPSQDVNHKLENEFVITRQLNIRGIRRALSKEFIQENESIILEYVNGETLDSYFSSPRDIRTKLDVAVKISYLLNKIHSANVVHQNICGLNILIESDTGNIVIIDFGSAATIKPGSQLISSTIGSTEGPLTHIAPEQTGRINRYIDYRTDFYSLGVTLYEIFCGKLPFSSNSPMELIHFHLAKTPEPPHKVNESIPEIVSMIILKLLQKNPDDRYQSAHGLHHDLEICLNQLDSKGTVTSFALGENDFTSELLFPQKLWGRESEIELIRNIFLKTARGSSSFLLVAGYSGAGKTSLIHELHQPVIEKNGFFVEGKYNQYQTNVPYAAWIQALNSFVSQLLLLGTSDLLFWKKLILDSVGEIGTVLIDVIPNLSLIIGEQRPAQSIGGIETQNRFEFVFLNFIKVIAQINHPLVVFLDDVQWMDQASLKLLLVLLNEPELRYLLIIFAYRENELPDTNPLMQIADNANIKHIGITHLTVRNLSEIDVNSLISNILHCKSIDAQSLSELIFRKTSGNPFFVRQIILLLYQKKLLRFDQDQSKWVWDINAIQSIEITDNVVQFMLKKMKGFEISTQTILKTAACVGNTFDLDTVATVTIQSFMNVRNELQKLINEGFIFPLDAYYKFAHDRIHQSAYALLTDNEKEKMHFLIGCTLLRRYHNKFQNSHIFEMVNHLNAGKSYLIKNDRKRKELAFYNLQAGIRAKASVAYIDAIRYFEMGIFLLTDGGWNQNYNLTLQLYNESVESAYLSGRFDVMANLAAIVHQHKRLLFDEIAIYEIEIKALITQGNLHEAIMTGFRTLDKLGMHITESPTEVETMLQFEKTLLLLKTVSVRNLTKLPRMISADKLFCMRILASIGSAIYVAAPELMIFWASVIAEFSLQYGNSFWSPFAYSVYALILAGFHEYVDISYQLGKISLTLIEMMGAQTTKSQIYNIFGWFIVPYKEHLKNGIPILDNGVKNALETGDFTYGSFSAYNSTLCAFFMGEPLDQFVKRTKINQNITIRFHQSFVKNWFDIWFLAAARLQNKPEAVVQADNKIPLENVLNANDRTGLGYYYLSKLMISYLFFENDLALKYADATNKNLQGIISTFGVPLFYFYNSLALLRHCRELSVDLRTFILKEVKGYLEIIQNYATHAPMNFQHKCDLILAEIAHSEGNYWEAAKHYQKAIKSANDNNFLQEQALANELAGVMFFNQNFMDIARQYFSEARRCYKMWNAWAKVREFETKYPQWFEKESFLGDGTLFNISENPDLESIIKATQAISLEIDLHKTSIKLLNVVLENAGAQNVFLLRKHKDSFDIIAEGSIETNDIHITPQIPYEKNERLSHGVVNYVLRTLKVLILNDAVHEGEFLGDSYILKYKPRSIACVPLIYGRKLSGILYLENKLISGIFSSKKVRLLEILAAQAAVSIENAYFFDELKALNRSLEMEITDHKKTETALRQSEIMFRLLAENSTDMVSRHSPDGIYLYVSPACRNLLGYEPQEMIGHSAFEFISPDTKKDVEQSLRGIIGKPIFTTTSYQIRRKDNTYIWFETTSHMIRDKNGKTIEIHATSRDISERRDAEQERLSTLHFFENMDKINRIIQEAGNPEQLLKDVLNCILNIFQSDRAWLLYPCDPGERAYRIPIEVTRPEYPGAKALNIEEPLTPEQIGNMQKALGCDNPVTNTADTQHEISAPKQYDIQSQMFIAIHPKIDKPWILGIHQCSYPRIWTHDEKKLFQEISRRLSDALTTQLFFKNLQESETKYHRIVDTANEGILVLGKDMKISIINHKMASLIGYDPDQIIDRPLTDFLFNEDISDHNKKIENRRHGISEIYERKLRHKNGHVVWTLTSAVPIINSDGNFEGSFAMYTDITKRKQYEDELIKYREHLEELVTKRTEEINEVNKQLKIAKEKAESANLSKSLFLTNMSHELRTPLNAILGFAQIFLQDKSLNEHQKNGISVIKTSGEHLLMLISDILDFARIEAHRLELHLTEIRLPLFFSSIEGIIRIRAEIKNISFTVEYSADLPEGIFADELRLRQILLNLLGNAVKFTDNGKVVFRVQIASEKPPALDHQDKMTSSIRFEVEDTGSGIASDQIENIFIPFEQVGEIKSRTGGTGLGLAISRHLVHLMGGEILVASEIGKGSRFWFELTFHVIEKLTPDITTNHIITGYKGMRRKVLIVDDQSENRLMMKEWFEKLGFEVVEAKNGAKAVGIASQIHPDLVIMNIIMHELNGFEFTKQIRKKTQFSDIVIILVSASIQKEEPNLRNIIGYNDFLTKPIDWQKMLMLLKKYLHLEWEYEEVDVEEKISDLSEPIPELPPDKLDQLNTMLLRGDMQHLIQWAEEIQKLDSRFVPFTRKLQLLARNYQEHEIQALVNKTIRKEKQ